MGQALERRLRGVYLPQRPGHGEPWKDMEPAAGGQTRVARGCCLSVGLWLCL